jgi:TRAP-type uncharacterized transport system substrate-binding protein
MEPLPRGANFRRAKFLWEIGLSVAGNPATPYGGDRDMCITIGNGSGTGFRPALRMATGSPILAQAVADGTLEAAMVNPSAFVTQAYRGNGLFKEPIPLRIVANYPSFDRFVFMMHPRTGLRSLKDIRDKKYPLHVSVKEDTTHSTRVFIDQALSYYGFSLADIESWGGRLNLTGPPMDPRRVAAMADNTLDAIFDEGLLRWLGAAVDNGMEFVELEEDHTAFLATLGWRRVLLPKGMWGAPRDHWCIDYSGWPLYALDALPDHLAYEIARGVAEREKHVVWEPEYGGIAQVFTQSEGSPMDVPLHPGAERYWQECVANRQRQK